jgi:hypothetical protein
VKTDQKELPRPPHVAAADWASISLQLRVFDTPEIKVTEQRTRKTVVAKKWIFLQRD